MSIDDNKRDTCQKLWDEYEPTLRRFCRLRMQSNSDEIDDVVIQTFVEFLEAMNKGANIRNYKGYIFKICERIIIRNRKEASKRRRFTVSLESLKTDLYYRNDFDYGLLDELTEKELNDIINDTLSEADIILLKLFVERNMTYKQLAKMYQTTESAIKQRKYRITQKFKNAVNEYKKNK